MKAQQIINGFIRANRMMVLAVVCGAFGAVANVVVFFTAAFLFAGVRGDDWVRWYFGTYNGIYFLLVTACFGALIFPFVKKMKTS
jgi:hypothetical protein